MPPKPDVVRALRHVRLVPDSDMVFIDDGRIELDNNTVERSIRPIALNRKNALFAGSDGGAEHWATNGHPNRDIDQLLPWAYRTQSRGLGTALTPEPCVNGI